MLRGVPTLDWSDETMVEACGRGEFVLSDRVNNMTGSLVDLSDLFCAFSSPVTMERARRGIFFWAKACDASFVLSVLSVLL